MKKFIILQGLLIGLNCFSSSRDIPFWQSSNSKIVVVPESVDIDAYQISTSWEAEEQDRVSRNANIRRLHELLRLKLSLDYEQASDFTEQLLRSDSLESLIAMTSEFLRHIGKQGQQQIALPKEVLIVAAAVLNDERHRKGTWNHQLSQQEQRIIQAHLVKNPDSE